MSHDPSNPFQPRDLKEKISEVENIERCLRPGVCNCPNMPRHKVSDMRQQAFWAFLASAPGGWSGYKELTGSTNATDKTIPIAEVVCCCVAVAFLIYGFFHRRKIQTSEEYLDHLYGIPAPKEGVIIFIRSKWKYLFG